MNQPTKPNPFSHAASHSRMCSSMSSQNPHRLMVEQMPVAMAMVDDQMHYLVASQAWQEMFQLEAEWVGYFHNDLFPHLPQTWSEKASSCLAGNLEQWEQSCYVSLRNGSVQWMQWKVQSWRDQTGKVGGLILMIQNASTADILIPDPMMVQTNEAVLWITLEGYICYANEAACHCLGYHQLELLQLRIDQIDPDMVAVVWQDHYQQLTQYNNLRFNAQHQTQTEELLPVSVRAHYLDINAPEPIVTWWIESIADKKANDAAVTAYKDQLLAVLNAVPGLVSWISSDLKYVGVNQHLAEAYNLPAEAFIGQPVGFLETSPEFNQLVYDFFASDDWIESREVTTYVGEKPRVYLVRAQKYQRGEAAVFVGLDITERIQIESALQESQQQETRKQVSLETTLKQLHQTQLKLIQTEMKSSLDQVVAGVAHEINNPVSFIYGNLFHLGSYTKDLIETIKLYQHYYPNPPTAIASKLEEIEWDYLEEDVPQLLDSMTVGAERVRDVVKALYHFSNLDKEDQRKVNLEDNLESVLLLLKNRLLANRKSSGIQLTRQYSSLPYINCYPGQLNQVFFNLISYVIDRLEAEVAKKTLVKPPTLTLKTEIVDIDTVRVLISGNTTAISPEACQQMFESPSQPTLNCSHCGNLGLCIAYMLVTQQVGGQLECFSGPSEGITFVVTLPRKLSPVSKHFFYSEQ